MPRWQPFDVVGGAYSDDTRPWTVQDTVNYLVVNAERPGGRSNKMLRGVPGMVTFSASMPESSVRGLYVAEGRLFAVVGTTLYRIATDGSAASLGTIPGVGRCVFTHNQVTNGNQVVIGNGQSGYVYDTVAGTLTQITDDGFPGFRSVDFADQYVIGVEPFGRYWFHSDLADAKSYNTLDRAEAEKAPDRIQQAIATGSDILVLSERTGQFFYDTGEATGTFQNRSGAEMDVGAGSPYTACRLDNTVYWLGNDGSVYRLNGYVPQRISTHALEQAISRCNLSDAYAFTFEDRGHKCYLLTFPDGQTWCFDAATQEWTRRESYGFNRWRVSALVKWGRHWIAGDFINGKLYQLDWRVQQEAGDPLERRRITGVLHDDQNRLIVNAFELVFDTGMDEDSAPLPQPMLEPLSISGDVPSGNFGDSVNVTYAVSGGVPAYGGRTITSGSLPPGLSMSAAGVVTGAYSATGSYTWTVSVTDAAGTTATVTDSATVSFVDVTWYASVNANNYAYGRSPDGNDWTEATRSGGTVAANTSAVGFALGRLYVIAQTTGVCTLDESTFTPLTGLTITGGANTVVEVAGKAVLIGTETANSGTSADGITFSTVTHSVSRTLYGHGLNGGTLVVGATNGYVQRCTDGVSFTDVSLFGGTSAVRVCSGRVYFFAHCDNGTAQRSTDGVTWVGATTPYNTAAKGFFYGTTAAGEEVLIGFSNNDWYYSINHGDTWALGGTQNGACGHAAEGRFVIAGGTFYTSTTGTSFASVTDAHANTVRNIVTGTL